MKDQLKPCPFCGSGATLHERNTDDGKPFYIQCDGCSIEVAYASTREGSLVLWNARAEKVTADAQPVVGFPQGFRVKRVEGHGWVVDPPSGSRWVAFEGTPAGELMQALAAPAGKVTADAGSQAEPIATLHDDGYYTWKKGKEPHESRYAGWRMDVYARAALASSAVEQTASDTVDVRAALFDAKPTLRQYKSSEPSLREAVHLYYKKRGMNDFEATNLTTEYFDALLKDKS